MPTQMSPLCQVMSVPVSTLAANEMVWGSITGSGLDGLAGWDHP
jgi:hypothetical protein